MRNIIVISFITIVLLSTLFGCKIREKTYLEQEELGNIGYMLEDLSSKTLGEVEENLGDHISEIITTGLIEKQYSSKGYLLINREYKINGKIVTVYFGNGIVSGWSY